MEADIQISYRKIKNYGVGGFPKILRNFQSGSWQMLTSDYKVGGVKKGPKHAYVIFEWSLMLLPDLALQYIYAEYT